MKLFLIPAVILGLWTQPMLAEEQQLSTASELELDLRKSSNTKIHRIAFEGKTITFSAPESEKVQIDKDEEYQTPLEVSYDKFNFKMNVSNFSGWGLGALSLDFSTLILEEVKSLEEEGVNEIIYFASNSDVNEAKKNFSYETIIVLKFFKNSEDFKKGDVLILKSFGGDFGGDQLIGSVSVKGSSKDLIEMLHTISFVRVL